MRKSIAVLIDHLDHHSGGYESQLRAAFDRACRRLGADLILVQGYALGGRDPKGAAYSTVYELVGPKSVDGMILLSGGLSHYCGLKGLVRFCQARRPLAVCSIGVPVPAVPSILVDGAPGMRAAVEHLLLGHGCRRIALVAGPQGNVDARERLEVCRRVLGEHGADVSPELLVFGDFTRQSGEQAVATLVARNVEFDAVVAANDGMGVGVVHALKARGVRVPEQVRVTGFDDLPMARLNEPPLSTVRQPLARMAEQAVEIVMGQISGQPVSEYTLLGAEFVARGSCGCGPGLQRVRLSSAPGLERSPSGTIRAHREELLAALAGLVRLSAVDGPEPSARILAALEAELDGQAGAFCKAFDELSDAAGDDNEIYEALQKAITLLREVLGALCMPEFEELWHEARCRVARLNTASQAAQRIGIEALYTRLLRTGERFSTALDGRVLKSALAEELPRAGIHTAFLALYTDPSRACLAPFFCLRDGLVLEAEASEYDAASLLRADPLSSDQPQRLIVLPLTFYAETLGAAVFELEGCGALYDMLREQISASLKTGALHREIVEQTAAHERIVQERLATAERIKSLSLLAGGVAHDLNNSLGPLVALPDLALEELSRLCSGPEDARELRDDLVTIKSAALRASQTIKDLLTLGRQGHVRKDPLDLNRAVLSCMQTHPLDRVEAERRRVKVTVELSREPLTVLATEAQIVRAVSNLVCNAAEAIERTGEVRVTTSRRTLNLPFSGYEVIRPGDYAVVTVSDNGVGMPESVLRRVFEPFYSRKKLRDRSGTGIGLAIVHGVVKDHDGFVNVESQPGRGATFTLWFPRLALVLGDDCEPSPMPCGTGRVLVVDDDPVQLRTARRVLGRLGYEVTTVRTGAEALSAVCRSDREAAPPDGGEDPGRSPFDLIVMDVILQQEEDGLAVLEEIRSLYPGQRGIIVSGHAPSERGELAVRQGLDWLSKPYTPSELAHIVDRALSRGPGVPVSWAPASGES